MKISPISLIAFTGTAGALFVAGCGGGGTNPPTPPVDQIPIQYTYPAYHTTGPDGEELYLLLKKTGNTLDGEFMYFIPESEDTSIMSGPAQGTVAADGTVHLTLTNPYDSTVPPIETEGVQTENGWRLHDVETPEEVVEFTKIEGPTVTRGTFGNTAEIYIEELDQKVTIDHNIIPVSLLPVAYQTSVVGGNKSTYSLTVPSLDGEGADASVWVCSWTGTQWTWVDFYRHKNWKVTHTARLWMMTNILELDTHLRSMSSDSAIRDFTGNWHKIKGTIGPGVAPR